MSVLAVSCLGKRLESGSRTCKADSGTKSSQIMKQDGKIWCSLYWNTATVTISGEAVRLLPLQAAGFRLACPAVKGQDFDLSIKSELT
jgi:hypothetical protein